MKLIDWINGKTKLNKTTFDEFQNNINDGKVDKTGDTMNGPLSIVNKNTFEGVQKTRTVNNVDYTATFGVGSDGSASIEIHNNVTSGILGRIDVNIDGKIKNYKTNKYLAEQSAWQTATTNSNYCKGTCKYILIGDALIVTIQDLIITAKVSHQNVLFSGLPSRKRFYIFSESICKKRM